MRGEKGTDGVKGIVFQGYRRVAYETVPDPRVESPRDAVVRVELAGVCGSDLHPYHEREEGLDPGTVMGHEFVGELVEVGAEVRGLVPGQRVFSPFTTNCGACYFCRSGLTSRCPQGQLFGWIGGGVGLHGAQAEFVRVPLADTTLLPVPEGLGVEEALLLGDVFATGYFCARQAGVDADGVYAVIGCGPVGLSAVLAARLLGAEMIYAVDVVPERLALAQEFGAVPIDAGEENAARVLHEVTEGRGADAVMEAVGSFDAERLAIEAVRPGGTLSVVGVHCDERFAFTPNEAYDKNLTYRVGRCPARALMERLAATVRQHELPIARLISHRLPLAQGPEGYRLFDEKRDGCTKVVLVP